MTHPNERVQKNHLPAGDYAKIVQDRASAPAPAGTRPYGIPVDDAEFLVFLAAGEFTPEQVRTIRQMIAQMEASLVEGKLQGVVTPADEAKSLEMIEAMKNAVASYPADTGNPFNP